MPWPQVRVTACLLMEHKSWAGTMQSYAMLSTIGHLVAEVSIVRAQKQTMHGVRWDVGKMEMVADGKNRLAAP